MLPPLPAIGSVKVELFGPPAIGFARWGSAIWGTDVWAEMVWRDVTPESMNVQSGWGADTPAGVLSVPAAGTWSIATYDPDRMLDPSNPDSQFAPVIRPGTPMRVRYVGAQSRSIRTGTIESIDYSINTATGAIRATDGVALMAKTKVPAGTAGAPTTLRARARWLMQQYVLPISVEPAQGSLWDQSVWDTALWGQADPAVGAGPTDDASVWDWVMTAALDALYAVWVDGDNMLRFRSFGEPRDMGLILGDGGIAMDDLLLQSSTGGVFSKVIGYDDGAPAVPIVASSLESSVKYGVDATYERTHPVPDGLAWVTNVLEDRRDAGLQYAPSQLRPTTEAGLLALIDAHMVDVAHIEVSTRQEGTVPVVPVISVEARVLGGGFEANTLTGWSATLVTYITSAEWDAL